MAPRDNRTVWSSDGDLCAGCGRPPADCACGRERSGPTGDRKVRVSREVKGRRGKGVTVVRGLPLDAAGLEDLARDLKKLCGTGGSVKDGAIEIQGDQRDRVVAALIERGHAAKKAGG